MSNSYSDDCDYTKWNKKCWWCDHKTFKVKFKLNPDTGKDF